MISGNRNRSPQYAMGPGGHTHASNQQHFFAHTQQQQQPHLLFMAGGSVRGIPQMSRGYSMMPGGGGHLGPAVMQCNMQQGFHGGYGYSANSAPMFQQQHYYHQKPHAPPPQPQLIHHQPQQQQHFIQQTYISPPPRVTSSMAPTSGFINGIKNMVKGLINPLNCDFYSDHHKYYNPKYRNNYMRDIAAERMSYAPQQPEPHVQSVVIGLEVGNSRSDTRPASAPKANDGTVDRKSPPTVSDVVALFSSEDFPELPAPRHSRSVTPAKTEQTTESPVEVPKETVTPTEPIPASPPKDQPSPPASRPRPSSTFFEIKCSTAPCGRWPTFGGRLKVVPPPFSLNKRSPPCQTRRNESTKTRNDCDTEEDSFVIFPNERPEDCLFSAFGCRVPRQRQISECSDDSFVVFYAEDADNMVNMGCNYNDDDFDDDEDDDEDDDDLESEDETSTEEEEDNEDDSDSESDEDTVNGGTDVVDSSFLGRNKTDRNKCAAATLACPDVVCHSSADHLDSGFAEKKVTFNTTPVVHVMHAWNFAYRAARKGHWEDFARDRNRFQKRIERTSVYINPILTPEHREKIYRSRFCDDAIDQPTTTLHQQSEQQANTVLETRSPQTAVGSCEDNQRLPKFMKTPNCSSF